MMFKNWNGESLSLIVDLKNNKNVTKIGEFKLKMEVQN